MTYAAILILLGFRLYARKSRLAPVFPGCGILLLFSIVLETHARYHTLSTLGAYAILFAGGATLFAMSIRHRASTLICLGVPVAAAVAMAIDFPYPSLSGAGIAAARGDHRRFLFLQADDAAGICAGSS